MRIHLVPIEPLQERYSAQWYRWWPEELERLGHEVHMVDGRRLEQGIGAGQFLDMFDTHFYKAAQQMALAQRFRAGDIRDGDTILFLDAWNPTIEACAYMRDASGRNVQLAGLWHAGTYDPHDFITQRGMERWAQYTESAIGSALDHSFFATRFHRRLFERNRIARGMMHVTGFPLYAKEWEYASHRWSARPRRVVFPHRLAEEKQPDAFERLQRAYASTYPDDKVEWVCTAGPSDLAPLARKHAYYETLGGARVAVSFAKQETWGIAMLEAASLGCHILAPNRLSYVELYAPHELFDDVLQPYMVKAALDQHAPRPWDGRRWESAIAQVANALAW